jgi:catalase
MNSKSRFILPLILSAIAVTACAQDLALQIGQLMSQRPSAKQGLRFAHPKGIVCSGTFEASPGAASISRASHFRPGSVPVTVRFSNAAPDLEIGDNSPDAGPQGMAIRFMTGRGTDIVALSHNGFVVGTGEEFLELLKAAAATDPAKPHPWPIEQFLGSHPRAMKFVQDTHQVPASFATESFFGNNAFRFTNTDGKVRAGRYQILPADGTKYLEETTTSSKSADFLRQDIRERLGNNPVKFRLFVQLAGPDDKTSDGSEVWPDDREKVAMGTITLTSVAPDSVAAENELAFDPTRLIDGIQLSDDPLPRLRSQVYAISVASRRRHQPAR